MNGFKTGERNACIFLMHHLDCLIMKKKQYHLKRVFSLLFLLGCVALQGQSVSLPMGHWLYDFFDRMTVRGVSSDYSQGMHPITRQEAANVVEAINQAVVAGHFKPSRIELAYLKRACQELEDVHSEYTYKEPHLFSWQQSDKRVFLDGVMGLSMQQRGDEARPETQSVQGGYYGAILRGHIGRLAFYTDNRIFGEQGGGPYIENYDVTTGYPVNSNTDSSMATWDQSISTLSMTIGGIQLKFGRDRLRWGPARKSGLILSGRMPAFDALSLKTVLGGARFQFFHGALRSCFDQKWLVGHRVELPLGRWGRMGLSETVIYGDRGLEASYLNPVLPFLIAEHSLGDRDNVSLGLDGSFLIVPGLQGYAELFIDDLVAPWTLFNDKWSNKVAFLAGLHWTDPVGWQDAMLTVEYHRIDPYVYTHKYDVNVYEHYDEGIGSVLSPNSDRLSLDMKKYFAFGVVGGLIYQRDRHGEGDRRMTHQEEDGEKKNFLKGPKDTIESVGGYLDWEVCRDLFVRAALDYRRVRESLNGSGTRHYLHFNVIIALNW